MLIEQLDACAEALRTAGLPCTEYQMWLDEEDLVHYWFGFDRPLTDVEHTVSAITLNRYLRQD